MAVILPDAGNRTLPSDIRLDRTKMLKALSEQVKQKIRTALLLVAGRRPNLGSPEQNERTLGIGDIKLIVDFSDAGGRQYTSRAAHEEYVSTFYDQILTFLKPTLVVDVGSNYGFTGLVCAKRLPHARIVLIKPVGSNLRNGGGTEVSLTKNALFVCALLMFGFSGNLFAADWPMWGYDAARGFAPAEPLPVQLTLRWTRQLPVQRPAWPGYARRLQPANCRTGSECHGDTSTSAATLVEKRYRIR